MPKRGIPDFLTQPSMVRVKINWTWVSCLILVLTTAARVYNHPIMFVFLTYIIEKTIVEWRHSKVTSAYWICVGFLALNSIYEAYVLALTILLLWDQKRKFSGRSVVTHFVEKSHDLATNVLTATLLPQVGCNSFSMLDEVKSHFDPTAFTSSVKRAILTLLSTEAVRLRPNGITDCPLIITERPSLEPVQVAERFTSLTWQGRSVVFITVALIIAILGGPISGMMVFALIYLSNADRSPEMFVSSVYGAVSGHFSDGVYSITTRMPGLNLEHGIGVAHGGVMHVPYHVCRGRTLVTGKTQRRPYMVDIPNDLVTYGGPPHLSTLSPGDIVYVNCESETRTTYRVEASYDTVDHILCWQGVTKPGESGSPVWALREDGLHLLGLAGRYIQHDDEPIEFTKTSAVNPIEQRYIPIVSHPGSGKTRTVLPQIIRDNLSLMMQKDLKILVTGPTRVVCSELHRALSVMTRVGLNIKGSQLVDKTATVQIAAHASALRMICSADQSVSRLGMVIIDEAHFDDVSTRLLRAMMRTKLETRPDFKLVEMSATLDGEYDSGSNHEIVDHVITHGQLIPTVGEQLQMGKKVMVFVKSLRSEVCKRLSAAYSSYKVVRLSRETFDAAIVAAKSPDTHLIITTDIAECGINVPDLDVVVDTGEKYTFVNVDGITQGMTINANQASRIQRRGRVGRSKPGEYYFVKPTPRPEVATAAELDANVLMINRSWAMSSFTWPFSLSDKQFSIWLSANDATPMQVYIDYDQLGRKRSADNRAATWAEFKGGPQDPEYVGCGKSSCHCAGHYRVFDERIHDRVFNHDSFRDPVLNF